MFWCYFLVRVGQWAANMWTSQSFEPEFPDLAGSKLKTRDYVIIIIIIVVDDIIIIIIIIIMYPIHSQHLWNTWKVSWKILKVTQKRPQSRYPDIHENPRRKGDKTYTFTIIQVHVRTRKNCKNGMVSRKTTKVCACMRASVRVW